MRRIMGCSAARRILSRLAMRRVAGRVLLLGALGTLVVCGFAWDGSGARVPSAAPAIQLVETFPIETPLDHPEIPDAYLVWREMIDGATQSLEFAEFYASNAPNSRLEEIVTAIEDAAARGVRVRFLAEEKFHATYPHTLDRLAARAGIEVRRFDVASLMGGVLHAKYFIVDGREAYLGSQNFDWRALTHIQELGVRIRNGRVVRALADLFEGDWTLAGDGHRQTANGLAQAPGERKQLRAGPPPPSDIKYDFPVTARSGRDSVRITPVFSPRGWLPDESLWDLPRLVEMIDAARETLRVQLLSYRAIGRDGTYFGALETALQRAGARGVTVQMLLADWCKRRGTIEGLQDLQALPGIEVRLATIPPWSGGFIPYARVIHAKYLVVDGRQAWIGTSNWEEDYFHASRNVGVIVEGRSFAAALDAFFRDGWNGPYAETVNPGSSYVAPRIGQ